VHLDLIIARIGIHEAKELVSCHSLYQLMNPQEEITILWACSVEACKFDADSLLPVLFLHEDGIREPVGVKHFSDKAHLG